MSAATFESGQVSSAPVATRSRWAALVVLCLGVLMIVLDTTIVNVALPSIREELQLTNTALVWVVNAYMLTFGGCLLLGGRLGDLYGHRRLFLIGVALFTLASIACGSAHTLGLLVAARAAQGLGGAIVVSVALSLIVSMFTQELERAKAMGIYGLVCACGGGLGLLLGGTLTTALNWHWVFLVNLPVGVTVSGLCVLLIPEAHPKGVDHRIDAGGAITVTSSLMLALFAIAKANQAGWASPQILSLLACAALLLLMFLRIETRVAKPLVPLTIFRLRSFTIANVVRVLWAAGASVWTFTSALYLQLVLGYTPLQVGLTFLPMNVLTAAFSLGLSAKVVERFGAKRPLAIGLVLGAVGLALFARAPVDGVLVRDVLPGMILFGLGAGIAFVPLLLVTMCDIAPSQSGVASGILNTASLMGGALGLAILTSLSETRTTALLEAGAARTVALTEGYHLAFALAATCAGLAAVFGAFLRAKAQAPTIEEMPIAAPEPARAKE
jgi:EmrB/QacA subfamily drug resistance transporter